MGIVRLNFCCHFDAEDPGSNPASDRDLNFKKKKLVWESDIKFVGSQCLLGKCKHDCRALLDCIVPAENNNTKCSLFSNIGKFLVNKKTLKPETLVGPTQETFYHTP